MPFPYARGEAFGFLILVCPAYCCCLSQKTYLISSGLLTCMCYCLVTFLIHFSHNDNWYSLSKLHLWFAYCHLTTNHHVINTKPYFLGICSPLNASATPLLSSSTWALFQYMVRHPARVTDICSSLYKVILKFLFEFFWDMTITKAQSLSYLLLYLHRCINVCELLHKSTPFIKYNLDSFVIKFCL